MKFQPWVLVAAAAFVMAGCGNSGGDAASAEGAKAPEKPAAGGEGASGKKLKIAMIAKSSNNSVFQSAKVGAEKAAEELSQSTGAKITVDWLTPPEEDAQVQAQRIEQAVNEGADAILVSCSDAAKLTGAINDAVDKGVPVMTFDSDAPMSKRFAFYGADDLSCGAEVMAELAKLSDGKPMTVAILAGNQNAPNLQKRVQGAQEEAKKHPNIKVMDSVVYHKESPQDASAAVTAEMNAKPEINAWAMIGGWPLFNTSLLTLDPAKVKIVAVDGLPAELAYVDKGIAPVLLAQPTYNWGYKSVGIIVDKVLLKKDVPVIQKMDLIRVTKETLPEWAKQLQDWGFTDVDPKYLAPK